MAYLERTFETLQEVGANILGVVLNHFDMRRAYGLLYQHSGFGYYGGARKYGRPVTGGNNSGAAQKKTTKS